MSLPNHPPVLLERIWYDFFFLITSTPLIPRSASKELQKFLIQKLFLMNFEDISNDFQIIFQRDTSCTSKVVQNFFKSTSKVF